MYAGKPKGFSGKAVMKIGISTFAYNWSIGVPGSSLVPAHPMTFMDFIISAKDLGTHLVQFGDNLPLHVLNSGERAELLNFAQSNGIDIQAGTRGLRDDILEIYLQLAEYFSSDILRVVIDLKGYEPSIEETIAILKRWEPRARAKNIVIAIENHDRFTCDKLIEIIDAVDSPFVRICLDTVNSFGALEGPDLVIKKLAPYTINVHIKDFTIGRLGSKLGFIIQGAPAGAGVLDMDLILKNPQIHADTAVLELWTPPEETIGETIKKEISWVQQSVNYLGRYSVC